jgi:hypothetical protein
MLEGQAGASVPARFRRIRLSHKQPRGSLITPLITWIIKSIKLSPPKFLGKIYYASGEGAKLAYAAGREGRRG